MLIPVYFIFSNEKVQKILGSIESLSGYEAVSLPEKIYNTLLGDNFQLTVSTKEQSPLKSTTGTNIQGWLAGNGDASSPTIAIVANYDSLSASTDLSKSSLTTTSSSVILLELARVFNKLYSQSRTQSNYNILFVLSAGGHFNHMGSKQWLNQVDDRIIKSLEFVLCLDSLGHGKFEFKNITIFKIQNVIKKYSPFLNSLDSKNLYLHTSRPEKDSLAKRLYDVSF